MKTIIGLMVWITLSTGYWVFFAATILPLSGREGGGHIMGFIIALAIWLLLSGLPAFLSGGPRQSEGAG